MIFPVSVKFITLYISCCLLEVTTGQRANGPNSVFSFPFLSSFTFAGRTPAPKVQCPSSTSCPAIPTCIPTTISTPIVGSTILTAVTKSKVLSLVYSPNNVNTLSILVGGANPPISVTGANLPPGTRLDVYDLLRNGDLMLFSFSNSMPVNPPLPTTTGLLLVVFASDCQSSGTYSYTVAGT